MPTNTPTSSDDELSNHLENILDEFGHEVVNGNALNGIRHRLNRRYANQLMSLIKQDREARERATTKSACGCPMCTYHKEVYEIPEAGYAPPTS